MYERTLPKGTMGEAYHGTMCAPTEVSILGLNDQKPAARSRQHNNYPGAQQPWQEGTVMNRMWFEIIRFYLLVALRGDPKEHAPEARPVERAKPAPIAGLKPSMDAK